MSEVEICPKKYTRYMVSYYKYKAFSSSLTKGWSEGLFSGELDNIYIYEKGK